MYENSKWLRITVITFTTLAFAVIGYVFVLMGQKGTRSPTRTFLEHKRSQEAQILKDLQFNLTDPGEAPSNMRDITLLGYEIMLNTKKYAPEFAGNRINCTNCHFGGGDTTGGPQSGMSLVGVGAKYPTFDKSFNTVIPLSTRINSCFTRSLNGKPVPLDHEVMLALTTYFQWISKGLPIYAPMPWLGITYLKTDYQGDKIKGKVVYETYCASCHKEDGEGTNHQQAGVDVPPLWGKDSFNDKAGFNQIKKLSAFIYWNMPYFEDTPMLTESQAIDVAAYILSKPRPEYRQ